MTSSEPQEGTVEYWQQMQRDLLMSIQNMLGAYGVPTQNELPWSDVERIVNGVSSHDDPMESGFACDLANLGTCAVELYKLQQNTTN